MITAIIIQIIQSLFLILLAPLLTGWVRQNRAWLNNKNGPGLLQPYYNLRKLLMKQPVLAENASFLFCAAPTLYFACMCTITAVVPVLSSQLPFTQAADVIVLVGIFALARMFLALAAMDVGTAFGFMGARREMFVGFLAEPALLIVLFNAAIISQSTSLSAIVIALAAQTTLNPGLAFAAVAFFLVLLAENARLPVDNPSTHLELTMIHEAMALEYSGRYLALIEWASALKLLNFFALGLAIFLPWGIPANHPVITVFFAGGLFILKIMIIGFGLALLETMTAKIRLFRVSEFLMGAFVLAILAILLQLWVGK